MKVADLAETVRAKNAGPFWLTIDIFCRNSVDFEQMRLGLTTARVANALAQPPEVIRRFDMPELNVLKFSLPRPITQGHPLDRDLHGAQWAIPIAQLTLDQNTVGSSHSKR